MMGFPGGLALGHCCAAPAAALPALRLRLSPMVHLQV